MTEEEFQEIEKRDQGEYEIPEIGDVEIAILYNDAYRDRHALLVEVKQLREKVRIAFTHGYIIVPSGKTITCKMVDAAWNKYKEEYPDLGETP